MNLVMGCHHLPPRLTANPAVGCHYFPPGLQWGEAPEKSKGELRETNEEKKGEGERIRGRDKEKRMEDKHPIFRRGCPLYDT